MDRLSLGNITITWLSGGNFELDGGTMYGAVPKALWQKKLPADDQNYIKFPNAPLLIQTNGFNLIVDTGTVLETPRARVKTIAYPQGPSCL